MENPRAGRLPPLIWLRAFEAAARYGSFTAAADDLALTQAAISNHVRSLEAHFNVQLFERLARGLRLTEIGCAYLPAVRRAFHELTESTTSLFGDFGAETLTIRAPISFASLCVSPLLAAFAKDHPKVQFRLTTANWGESAPDSAGDIEIRYGLGPWPGFEQRLVYCDESIPVCSPTFLEDCGADIVAACATGVVHVMGCEDLWPKLLRRAGKPDTSLRVRASTDTSLMAADLAAQGLGCAMVLKSFALPYLTSGRLVAPFGVSLPLEHAHHLLLPVDARLIKPTAMLFCDWVRNLGMGWEEPGLVPHQTA